MRALDDTAISERWGRAPARTPHRYATRIIWTGDRGSGTSSYTSYGRDYRVLVDGKPELAGSADAAFRGEPDRHNPEDLFLAAVAACHMLFYLSLCARQGVRVLSYEDEAAGTLVLHPGGSGRFDAIVLNPVVVVAEGSDEALARRLHDEAHRLCFIANSCSVPIRHRATVRTAARALRPVVRDPAAEESSAAATEGER
ncbi:MAG TPA: OsmC family protein [Longimicrobiales bacterium]